MQTCRKTLGLLEIKYWVRCLILNSRLDFGRDCVQLGLPLLGCQRFFFRECAHFCSFQLCELHFNQCFLVGQQRELGLEGDDVNT